MGNTFCWAGRAESFSDGGGRKRKGRVVRKLAGQGAILSVSYTEWEDVVALSSAIAPGGKMLGLSSTRKLIATLHESVYDRSSFGVMEEGRGAGLEGGKSP